jgi:3-oxoadipate enol-lactonase
VPHLTRDGVRIWWTAEGDGPAVLLVMGLGYHADMWYRLLPYLVEGYRTVRFDNRGVGRTDVPAGPYPVDVLAADAAAVLAAAGEQQAHVVGISLGGVVAQALAVAEPHLVRSLVLLATHTGGRESVPPEPVVARMVVDRGGMTPRQAAEASVPFVYAADTPRALIDEDIAVRMRMPTSAVGYDGQLAGALSYRGSASLLPAVQVPTLIVHGTADRLVPVGNAGVLAAALPHAQVELLDGAGHILLTDRTERTGRLIRDFLDRQPR